MSRTIAPTDPTTTPREHNIPARPGRMTGADIALPTEDPAEIDKLSDDLTRELKPTTLIGILMIEQMLLATIRIRRCARFERAATSNAVRDAVPRFEEERIEDVNALMSMIHSDPELVTRRLMRKPEGVERMILEWQSLGRDLDHPDHPDWQQWHAEKGDDLLGHYRLKFPRTRLYCLSRCMNNDFSYLEPGECDGMDVPQKKLWARDQIRSIILDQIARLEAHRATIDHDPIAGCKADARDAASFDPSKAAAEARKYQAACQRSFNKALATFREVEAAAAKSRLVAATPVPASPTAELGSSCQTLSTDKSRVATETHDKRRTGSESPKPVSEHSERRTEPHNFFGPSPGRKVM